VHPAGDETEDEIEDEIETSRRGGRLAEGRRCHNNL